MFLQRIVHNRWVAAICVLLLLLALSACGGSAGGGEARSTPPPGGYSYVPPANKADGWSIADAGEQGMSVVLIEAMMDAIHSGRFPIVDSIAIAHRGALVLDETIRTEVGVFDEWVGNADPAVHVLFSASKSITSIIVGLAIEQGLIESVEVPYLSLFDYESYENWDERKHDITLEHALTMRFGLEWNEWDPPYTSPDNAMLRFYETETDFAKSLLDLPMAGDPGTGFAYSTPGTVSLGQAVENVSPISLVDFGLNLLIEPLGIGRIEFFTTPTGLPDTGRGLYLATRDFLKFGQLYANEGSWNGRQLVSPEWVDVSTRPHVPLSWRQPERFDWQVDGYGYLWWTGTFEHDGRRYQSYAARGHGEQTLMVVPELALVVAVFADAWDEADDQVNQVFELISRFIIPALPTTG